MTTMRSLEELQSANWSGAIPIVLTLAPTSLSSPTLPPPVHIMLPRNTYLHIGLRDAVLRLYKFAPAVLAFSSGIIRNEPEPEDEEVQESRQSSAPPKATYPVCWLEDEANQIPLRWQLFVGLLFDLRTSKSLPWKIRLHFSTYPSKQIIPLDSDVLTTVERYFKNSLKQALFLEYGNSKVSMGMTKQTHERLWDAVVNSNFQLYEQINSEFRVRETSLQLIPVRLFHNSKPPIQRRCCALEDGKAPTLGQLLADWTSDLFRRENGSVVPCNQSCRWFICGIQPSLSSSIVDLWSHLAHPDHFLYISLLS